MIQSPLISILIPTYNGEEFFSDTLDSIVSQFWEQKVELVIVDDNSSDSTYKIAEEYAQKYSQIKLFKNSENLGMDGNFEKVAGFATGEYIWYSGQDDIFGKDSINKVIEVLTKHSELDFIYMNFTRRSHMLDNEILERHVNIADDIYCKDYKEFLTITTLGQLPSFLPSFIMRKSLFDKAEKKQFYGTQFVQLGAFFSVLKEMNLYIVANPYIIGRVPDNRWQSDSLKLLDILSGDLEVITFAYKNYGVVDKELYKKHYKKIRKWLLNTLISTKIDSKIINEKLFKRFKFIFNKKDYIIAKIHIIMPYSFYKNKFSLKILKIIR